MKRKGMIILCVLCVAAVILLVGCSGQDESSNGIEIINSQENNKENNQVIRAFETDVSVIESDYVENIEENDEENVKGNLEKNEEENVKGNLEKNAEEIAEEINKSNDRLLTLDRIIELSEKEKLDWSDFDGYACEDIGFGLRILKYDINDEFYLLVGGTDKGEPMYVRLVSSYNQDDYIELGERNAAGEAGDISEDEKTHLWAESSGDVERFIRESRSIPCYVSIFAHVKEINKDENRVLISSDTNAFPGIFSVGYVREAMGDKEFQALKGGTSIRILMQDMNQKSVKDDKIPVYKAKEIVLLSDDKSFAQEDILLTNVPELSLTDLLSSKYSSFSVQSGNYTWTVEGENGSEKQIVACGAAPLEEAKSQEKEKLKIPNYSMDSVSYRYSTKILPDILTLRQWDISAMEDKDAKEERITVYYDKTGLVELQGGKVYEFMAEWLKENFQQNKFYATAGYVVVTE